MKKVVSFFGRGKNVHLPKLIGAFILFAALLMFIKVSAEMFESWDNAKAVNACLAAADDETKFLFCYNYANESLGVTVRPEQDKLTGRQFWQVLLGPVVSMLIWLAVLFVGWMLYRASHLVFFVEEPSAMRERFSEHAFKRKR
ncbi:MAG: hypothetical protein V1676_01280 [Candidatus Diapherotrites archaeon]